MMLTQEQNFGSPAENSAPAAVQKKSNKALIGIIIGGLAVVALIIAMIFVIGSCSANSPDGVVKKAFECSKNQDYSTYQGIAYYANFSQGYDKAGDLKAFNDYVSSHKEEVENRKTRLKDAKITVTKDEKIDGSRLDDMVSQWSQMYRDTDKIEEVHVVGFEITGAKDSDTAYPYECYAVKVGGKWYVVDFPF